MQKEKLKLISKQVRDALPLFGKWKRGEWVPSTTSAILSMLDPTINTQKEARNKWERRAIDLYLNGLGQAQIRARLKEEGFYLESAEAILNLLWRGPDSFLAETTRRFINSNYYYCPFCSTGTSARSGLSFSGKVCDCAERREAERIGGAR